MPAFFSKSRKAFLNFTCSFCMGFMEEVTFNITGVEPGTTLVDLVVPPGGATQAPIVTKKIGYLTGAVLTNPTLKNKVVSTLSKATFNLI